MFPKKDTKNTRRYFEKEFAKVQKTITQERIDKAIAEGRLIPASEVFKRLDKKTQREIDERVKNYDMLNAIRKARLEKELSQEDLAKQTGLPRATISKIENGKRNVTWATLDKVLEALGLKIEFVRVR